MRWLRLNTPRGCSPRRCRVSGFSVRMLPVRTSRPIPRARRQEALAEIHKVKVKHAVKVGDTIIANLLGLDVDVIATRAIG